jgi:hypothetical protein
MQGTGARGPDRHVGLAWEKGTCGGGMVRTDVRLLLVTVRRYSTVLQLTVMSVLSTRKD